MKSKRTDLEIRYILLFKLDAQNLFNRIVVRQHDYIEAFSLKRNRAVFRDVFDNRYSKASIHDLSHCSPEVIEALNSYYQLADEIYWYLKHTQDMPNMIEDEVQRMVNRLKKQFELVTLYIDAELSGSSQEEIFDYNEISPAQDDIHNDSFQMHSEAQALEEDQEYLQPEQYPDQDLEDDENTIDDA
jgi:hypothetical protein